ncbi:unnamed protein product [Prorocentrum cordatum]|nr:unnamed protein product [Polarella glacialis]
MPDEEMALAVQMAGIAFYIFNRARGCVGNLRRAHLLPPREILATTALPDFLPCDGAFEKTWRRPGRLQPAPARALAHLVFPDALPIFAGLEEPWPPRRAWPHAAASAPCAAGAVAARGGAVAGGAAGEAGARRRGRGAAVGGVARAAVAGGAAPQLYMEPYKRKLYMEQLCNVRQYWKYTASVTMENYKPWSTRQGTVSAFPSTHRQDTADTADLAPGVIGHPEVFMPFSKVMEPLILSNNVLSLLAMSVWVKLFKYLCMSSYFRRLVRLIERCAARLVVFSLLLLTVFFGFAVAFFMGFGGTVQNFSTLSGSFLVLFFLLMDGFNLEQEWFQPGKDPWMPIMFVVYIATIYFVMLNIFVAVVLDVYSTFIITQRDRDGAEERHNPMLVFIRTYYNWLKGMSLVKEEAEGFLKAEDLSISLELLPGIVRRKWIEKKRRLQKIASEAFAGMELYPDDPTVPHREELRKRRRPGPQDGVEPQQQQRGGAPRARRQQDGRQAGGFLRGAPRRDDAGGEQGAAPASTRRGRDAAPAARLQAGG